MSNDDPVGYKKPPKKHQFKKNESGCPDGGHERRRAKKVERERKEKEVAKQQDERIRDLIRKVGRQTYPIIIDGECVDMAAIEIVVRNVFLRAIKPDASERHVAQALKLAQYGKLLEPKAEGARPMVLVVSKIQTQEQWAKDTEGELLPRDPLHGIPGTEGMKKIQGRRGLIPDVED